MQVHIGSGGARGGNMAPSNRKGVIFVENTSTGQFKRTSGNPKGAFTTGLPTPNPPTAFSFQTPNPPTAFSHGRLAWSTARPMAAIAAMDMPSHVANRCGAEK